MRQDSDGNSGQALFLRLQRAFRPDQARGMNRIYQLDWPDQETCHLELRDGTLRIGKGRHPAPDLVMYYPSADTALAVLEGHRHPVDAFMAGELRSSGHLIYALQLGFLFGKPAHGSASAPPDGSQASS